MNFNPKIGVYVSVIAVVVSVIAIMSPSAFPSYIPANGAAAIISTCAFLNILFNAVNGVLHLYSSSQPGPLAPPDPPAVKAAMADAAKTAAKAAAMLLIGLTALGALAMIAPGPARAANAEEAKVGIGPAPRPTPNYSPAPGSTVSGDSPLAQLANWFNGDAQSAVDLAYQFPTPPDGNGASCWTAGAQLGAIMKAHPNILTGKAMTDLEALRLATMQARLICNNMACRTVAEELASGVKNVTSSLPVSINLPTVNVVADICQNIPTLASVPLPTPSPTSSLAPASSPTSSPTPTPTSP